MADPWQWWTASEIARVTGCPQANVESNWPLIARALERRTLWERDVAGAVIATVAIETASTFQPIHEYGTPADWSGYSGGAAFAGRGYIQLTHDYGYRAAGTALGIDLLSNPDRAMEPAIAADILAWFWATKTVPAKDGSRTWTLAQLCREHDWEWVRRAVQGGTAGLARLIQIATSLGGVQNMPGIIPYNPDAPIDQQPDPWSCSVQSLQWLLRSIGRDPKRNWLEQQLVPALVSKDVGLLDGSGAQLAAWLTREYGAEMLFEAHATPVTFDDVKAGAGVNPTMVGGHGWNHWVGVRGYDPDLRVLLLANPADGFMGVAQGLSRERWSALGPFSAIYIDRGAVAAPIPVPDPVPTPDPIPGRMREIAASLRALAADLEALAS